MCRHQGWLAAAVLTLLTASGALAQPANDDFNNAVVIPSVPFTPPSIDTIEATTAPDDPDCIGQGPTVWYRLTPTVSQRVEFNTFGSSYDTTLSAYTGSPGALTQIVCNDDADSLQSRIRFDAVAGETYFIMVGAYASGPGGSLVLSVAVAPTAPKIHVTIDSFGSFTSRTGIVTITGTVTCSKPLDVEIFSDLVQKAGRFSVAGGFFTFVSCDGSAVWRGDTSGFVGRFAGGKVATSVFARTFIDGDFASDSAFANVTLRGR